MAYGEPYTAYLPPEKLVLLTLSSWHHLPFMEPVMGPSARVSPSFLSKCIAELHQIPVSVQVNSMIRLAVQKKTLLQVGPATNVWNSVHIDDLIELYGLVLDLAISGNGSSDPYENFFFGSSDSYVWADVSKELAKQLHARGLIDSDEPKSVAPSEAPQLTSSNSRSVANRSFALGWKPSGKSLIDTLQEEIDLTLSQM